MKKRKFLGGFNRFRLILTLGIAVLLPAAALIVVNFYQLQTFKRAKVLEAAIHRDFSEYLAISEKTIVKKFMPVIEDARNSFPPPSLNVQEKEKALDELLKKNPHLVHAMMYDEKGMISRSQPSQASDEYVRKEREHLADVLKGWFGMEGRQMVESLHKKSRPFAFYNEPTKRPEGQMHLLATYFTNPNVPRDRVSFGCVSVDPRYLKNTFFPGMLKEIVDARSSDQSGNQVAMMIYFTDYEGKGELKPITMTAGWGEGKPEASRRFDAVFGGLSMGIKFQGTSINQLGATWMRRNFIILGILAGLIVIGLILTKRVVSKEMALAKLKSDFVSNVSHELRTPLALIRLYAETLELGRITTKEKKQEYYRIVRKESERLTGLINNILDFSRIEAGAKEYEFRETDIADLVRNTLDSYRYQIEQQGFTLKEEIDETLPAVYVDREAMARALLNLVNNALKYSPEEKFLGVRLYRENGAVKLEVEDRGIGITRREQTKIFEKFYRTGDPLVHNTKGSGLGLSLVRHITNAHGGNVTVESTPGKGSKFILSLPLNGRHKIDRHGGRSNGNS
ncbi:MAG TPA: HAMP domain-containing sensor histidine kinase [Pyrinomonadaceae bacterium]|nr:HAMP domain-containing sensor histidine kinase [Pyrinomonadaceae bacterium]